MDSADYINRRKLILSSSYSKNNTNYLGEAVDKETRLNWDAPTQGSSGNFLKGELIIIAKLPANYQLSMKAYSEDLVISSHGLSFKTAREIVLKLTDINIL